MIRTKLRQNHTGFLYPVSGQIQYQVKIAIQYIPIPYQLS